MKNFTSIASVAVFSLGLALSLPAYAKNGADDPTNHIPGGHGADDPAGHVSGSHGADNPAGDDHGGSKGIEVPNPEMSNTRFRGKLEDIGSDSSFAKGKLNYQVKKHGGREELDVQIKIVVPDASLGVTDLNTAESAVVLVTFSDESGVTAQCTAEFDEIEHRKAEYRVRMIRKNTHLREKDGSCDIDLSNTTADPGMPAPQNGTLNVTVNGVSVASGKF